MWQNKRAVETGGKKSETRGPKSRVRRCACLVSRLVAGRAVADQSSAAKAAVLGLGDLPERSGDENALGKERQETRGKLESQPCERAILMSNAKGKIGGEMEKNKETEREKEEREDD